MLSFTVPRRSWVLISRWDSTGVCCNNVMSESYWATLLTTEFYDRRTRPTGAEARREVARWIETVYNRRRRLPALNYSTPVGFETTNKATPQKETKADVFT